MKKQKSLIKAILDIYRISQAYITPKTLKYGIGRGQWYFLNKLLFEEDGISQEELSKEMVVDSSHTARAIKFLEESGFVYRTKDPNDARKKNIYVTDKSVEIRDDYHGLYKDLNKILVKDFTSEEVELVRSLLYRMRDNIKSYIENTSQDSSEL